MRPVLISMSFVLCVSFALSPAAFGQVNQEFAEIAQQVEAARTLARADRKLLIMRETRLTPEEAEAFWPVYEEYADDLAEAGNLRVKVVTDYAANYEDLSDDMADELLKEHLEYNTKVNKIRKSYLRRFKKILPSTKVARFYQLENKLDALVNFNMAAKIPLVPVDESLPLGAP